MLTWLVLSGHFDLAHVSMGVASSLLIAWASGDLLFEKRGGGRIGVLFRWIAYLPYLSWQIVLSSVQVLVIVLHPRMMEKIDPQFVRFDTTLHQGLARMNLGNAITLTPGTLVVAIQGDSYLIHALTADFAAGVPGGFEPRLAKVFDDSGAASKPSTPAEVGR